MYSHLFWTVSARPATVTGFVRSAVFVVESVRAPYPSPSTSMRAQPAPSITTSVATVGAEAGAVPLGEPTAQLPTFDHLLSPPAPVQ